MNTLSLSPHLSTVEHCQVQNDLNKPKPIQKVRLSLTVKVLAGHAGWLSQAKLIATQEVKETVSEDTVQATSKATG